MWYNVKQNISKEQYILTYAKKLEAVKAALKDRKITAVAESVGMTRQAIYNIINGKTPEPKGTTIDKLAEYLGIEG